MNKKHTHSTIAVPEMKLLVEEMAVAVKRVAARTSNVITLTKLNVKLKPSDQKLMKFNARKRGIESRAG